MNGPRSGLSRTFQPAHLSPVVLVVLAVWILVTVFLAILFIFLGIPSLIVAALLGSVVLPLAIALFLRARSLASRLLHVTLERASLRAGETVRGHVELRTEQPLTLRSLEASARGGEKVEIVVRSGEHTSRVREESLVLDEVLVLRPEGVDPLAAGGPPVTLVSPGWYRYRFSVTIPETALPSFRGRIASVRYAVRVRASLPLRVDAVKEVEIPVLRSAVPSAPGEDAPPHAPIQLGSDHPQLVVDVKNREVSVGDTLRGYVTVSNLRDRRIEDVRLRIREREWGTARGQEASQSKTLLQTEVAASGGVGGLVAPFSLVVPDAAKESYIGRISSLRHYLRVRVRLAWARDLRAAEEFRVVNASS